MRKLLIAALYLRSARTGTLATQATDDDVCNIEILLIKKCGHLFKMLLILCKTPIQSFEREKQT